MNVDETVRQIIDAARSRQVGDNEVVTLVAAILGLAHIEGVREGLQMARQATDEIFGAAREARS